MDLRPNEPSPLKNETTGEYVNLDSRQRPTRSLIHRILKAHGVQHHASATLNQLLDLAAIHDIPLVPVPPGPVPDRQGTLEQAKAEPPPPPPKPAPTPDAGEYAEDGWPKNFGILKKMAKERGIRTVNTDKRADVVQKLNDYMAGLRDG